LTLPDIDTADLRTTLPKSCCDFFDFWLSLRENTVVPAFKKYSLTLHPAFLSSTFIVDPRDGGARMRFQGTNLVDKWNMDIAGKDLLSFMTEEVREVAYANYRTMADTPYGHFNTLVMSQDNGRNVPAGIIQLPLAIEGQPGNSLVGFLSLAEDLEQNRFLEQTAAKDGPGFWIDVGAGVPANPPFGHAVGKNIVKVGF